MNSTVSCDGSTYSIGHLVIDALASRLGIRMSSCRGGLSGKGNVPIGPDTLVELTLYKSSIYSLDSTEDFCADMGLY